MNKPYLLNLPDASPFPIPFWHYQERTAQQIHTPSRGRPCEEYLVRRLTPDECCRLQGYPDGWCKDLESEDPDEDEILFWTEVFREWDAINGKPDKVRSRNAILKWLTAPNSDAAEYKAYGNSVAVPCVFFVLAGIVWAQNEEVKS